MPAFFLFAGSIDFQGDVFDVDENLIDGDVIVGSYLQLPFEGFNKNFVHFLVSAMELDSLVVDPVENVLQIGHFGNVVRKVLQ